jgi:putative MATE family efflux protein
MNLNFFGPNTKSFLTKLVVLSAPIAVQQTIFTGVNLVDNLMIGRLSEANLAAAAVAGQVYFLVLLFLFGITSGSAILMSQYFGAHDLRGIRRTTGMGLLTGLPGVLIIMTISLLRPQWLLGIFTTDPEVIALAIPYQRIISLSYPATLMSNLFSTTLRSTREVKVPMVASSTALILNTIGNIILINGLFGFPRLGLYGAGIATLIARWIETGLIVLFTARKRRWMFFQLSGWFDFPPGYRKMYYRLVMPVVANEIFWSVGFSSYLAVFGRISTSALAAYNIQEISIRVFLIIFIAMGNGASILIGNTLGSGKQALAQEYALGLIKLGPLLAIFVSTLSVLVAPYVPLLYAISPEAQQMATRMLQLLAIVFPFKIINIMIIVAVFRSGGDTVFSFVMDAGVLWFVGVPLAFLSGLVWRIDPSYVFLIASTEEIIKALLGIWRVLTGKWIHVFTGGIKTAYTLKDD